MNDVPRNTILQGDVLDRLRELPNGCVQTVVTSPPYWGLRDYGTATWDGGDPDCSHAHFLGGNGAASAKQVTSSGTQQHHYRDVCGKCGAFRIDQQIGLEPTPAAYVARMVEVFREVRRVLRADGTCWVNMGDSYAAGLTGRMDSHLGGSIDGRPVTSKLRDRPKARKPPAGLKPKDLCGMPWRLAFALQDDGWYLRSDIIWSKPNPMPESVTDRPTKSHEYIFLLSKRATYYYDATAILEPVTGGAHARTPGRNSRVYVDRDPAHLPPGVTPKSAEPGRGIKANKSFHAALTDMADSRNKRSVWTVATEAYPDAHFATFPRKLIEPCILAGSSPQACETCGAPWRRVVEAVGGTIGKSWHDHDGDLSKGQRADYEHEARKMSRVGDAPGYQRVERGWRPTCRCPDNTGAARSLVLDPFMGSGTVAVVAQSWQRDYLGIELNPTYIEMAQRRLSTVAVRLFADGGAA